MSKVWPMVCLEKVLTYRKEFITINDIEAYKRCRVQLHTQGIVLRDIVAGTEIKTKKQQICKTGDFLVAEIDAKVGGFGIVPEELDSAIVSSHYFLFHIDKTQLDKRFLDFFIRTPAFFEQIKAQGSTNYAAIRPKDVLEYKIPFPPLSEQQRIVTRIEELAGKIEEAQRLRQKAAEEAETLLLSDMYKYFAFLQKKEHIKRAIATFTNILRGRGPIYQEGSGKLAINQKCVRWDGIDIIYAKEVSKEWIQELPSNYILQEDDILVNSTGEGTIGRACVVTPKAVGFPFDSHVLVIRTEKNIATSKFVAYFLRSPIGQAEIEGSKGAKTTKQTELGTTKLGNITISIPPLSEQKHIVSYLDNLQSKIDKLKRFQNETQKELDALMPSILDKAFKGDL
jgi:type I restriction enzyme S subunit